MKQIIVSIILFLALWTSAPSETGWYWIKSEATPEPIMVYVDKSENEIVLCDPSVKACAYGTLENVRPGVRFQGPVKPDKNDKAL